MKIYSIEFIRFVSRDLLATKIGSAKRNHEEDCQRRRKQKEESRKKKEERRKKKKGEKEGKGKIAQLESLKCSFSKAITIMPKIKDFRKNIPILTINPKNRDVLK